MLVLKRRTNQQIVIDGGTLVVTVLECCRDYVRLGFEADAKIQIDRGEVHSEKQRKKEELKRGISKSSTGTSQASLDA